MTHPPLLFSLFPRLADRVQPIPLGQWPTPIERIRGADFSQNLWVKRDDRSSALYGGSKVRNLEWILGDARARGATTLLTTAAWGSHMVLALALHGRAHGFNVAAALYPQPMSPEVESTLSKTRAAGAEIIQTSGYVGVPFALDRLRRAAKARGASPTYFVFPGGASPVGSLGYFQAAFELRDAVRRGELPEPDYLFCAAGSAGTLVGLVEGMAAAGLRTHLVAVRVVPKIAQLGPWIALMRRRFRRLLAEIGVPLAAPRPFTLLHQFLGDGYGHSTADADRALIEAHRLHGLRLESTYTAKAFAGMASFVKSIDRRDANILFLNTYGAIEPNPATDLP